MGEACGLAGEAREVEEFAATSKTARRCLGMWGRDPTCDRTRNLIEVRADLVVDIGKILWYLHPGDTL